MTIICHILGTALWLERFAKGRSSKALSADNRFIIKGEDVRQSSSIVYEYCSCISFLNSAAVVHDGLAIAIEYGEDIMKLAW